MDSAEGILEEQSQVFTIPGWGDITAEQLDSPFEDDECVPENILFSCDLCNKTFTHLLSLKKHLRITHGNLVQSSFKCKRTFKNIIPLKRHTVVHNDDKNVDDSGRNRRNKIHRYDQPPQASLTGGQPTSAVVRRGASFNILRPIQIFPSSSILKNLDFTKNENNLNIAYKQYFSTEEADRIFQDLEKEIEYFPSEKTMVAIFNKRYPVPRKVTAYGDESLTYTFCGNTLPTKPPTPILMELFKEASKLLKKGSFNYVLINRYKDGNDKIGSHKDNEKDMHPFSPIVTFSFGAERTMIFKRPNFDSIKVPLKNGSVLVMNPPTNKFWYHEIPRETKIKDVRIILTFRKNVSSACKK